jgi:DNA-binding NtrC family response regulator
VSRVLVIDDEPAVRFALVELLSDRGHEVIAAESGEAALAHLGDVDVVLTDLMMPGLDGLAVVRAAKQHAPGVPVIMLTARGNEKTAVEAMKAGATEYLTKPFDVDEVGLLVARAADHARLRRDSVRAAAERASGRVMIGDSPAMRALLAKIERVAPRDVTVLVRGESGTGKELVGTLLHTLGPRAHGPLVRFNGAAIPSELAESELFGHVKGAFTGATETRPGVFARAHGGTLIIDEVGEIPLALQPKLLRALQEGEIQPVGGTTRTVDVRVISSTNADLARMVRDQTFREDLYYRLAVVELLVPALRDRREDIPALARAFAQRLASEWRVDIALSEALIDKLVARAWPGNVRELENAIARLVVFADDGELGPEALETRPDEPVMASPAAGHVDDPSLPYKSRVDAFERAIITATMVAASGNRAEAARRLGMSRITLLDRMKRLGI